MSLGGLHHGQAARLRRRALIEPSEDDESGHGSDDGGHEKISGNATSDSDHWDDEEGAFKARLQDVERPGDGMEEEAIGDRLNRLAHGAGPSRRKRNLESTKPGHKEGEGAESSQAQARGPKVDERSGPGRGKPNGRANKNRPQEVSSLRAVGRFREVVTGKRNTSRDPRFEGGGGSSKLNYDIFRKAYGFLGTYQDSEIEDLKKSLRKEKNHERSGRLQAVLTRLQQERAERATGDRRRVALRDAKKKEREAVASGKKPYYLKASDKKKISLEQRYEGLKEEGKLGKFMEKKRKRNAAKDHRWLPSKRQDRG